MIPIDKNSNDPFYRYKMHEISVTHETSKTVMQNLEQISKELSRSPILILKFLSIHFGCNTITGKKYALNGNYSLDEIQDAIYDFIKHFVLCEECGNPETEFIYDISLKRSCNSCGAIFEQKAHKLNSSITKEKNINKDTKYESSNKSNLHSLIKEEKDNSKRIYEVYKQESIELDQIFSEYIKNKELKQLSLVLIEFNGGKILKCIEDMLEINKKENKIEDYMDSLIEMGISKEEMQEYAVKPRVGRKRCPIVKKIFDNFCD
jgi:translation initiation factor 2 beta subunit (eIF-2beta)/eIF-5